MQEKPMWWVDLVSRDSKTGEVFSEYGVGYKSHSEAMKFADEWNTMETTCGKQRWRDGSPVTMRAVLRHTTMTF